MKRINVLVPFIFIVSFIFITSLACGSSSTPQVNSPSSTKDSSNQTGLATPTVVAKTVGSSRTNPAPVGSEIIADEMALVVTEILRPADNVVVNGNMFNSTPEPGKEYLFVKVKITCQKSTDSKCSIYTTNYKLVTSTGNIIESEWFLAGVTGLLATEDFFGGASVEGYIAFIVDKSEANPVLMYEPFFGDTFYLSI